MTERLGEARTVYHMTLSYSLSNQPVVGILHRHVALWVSFFTLPILVTIGQQHASHTAESINSRQGVREQGVSQASISAWNLLEAGEQGPVDCSIVCAVLSQQ